MYNKVNVDPKLRISPKLLAEVISLPVTITVNEFNEEEVDRFRKGMEDAQNTGQDVVPVVIDSRGGQCYSLLAMIDLIDQSPIPVATIGLGKMASCGAILLSSGAQGMRYAGAFSSVMIHDVAGGNKGKVEELKTAVENTDRLNKLIYRRMAKNCSQSKNYFMEKIFNKHHAEWYLTPKEAKKENLIDHIGIPNFKVDISVNVGFGL